MSGAAIMKVPPLMCSLQAKMHVLTPMPLAYQVATHTNCICNELTALTQRHLVQPASVLKVAKLSELPNLPLPATRLKMGKLQLALSYQGVKRQSYLKAYHQLRDGGLDLKKWTKVKMFIKAEKIEAGEIEDKAPRAIQFRDQRYNLLVGCYLKPLEHWLYKNLVSSIGLRVIAKGLNNVERAWNLTDAASHFVNPRYLLLDHSKFDAHVHHKLLKWSHKQYYRATKSRILRYYLSLSVNNSCTSKHGISYRVKGTRMSGDYDTALGNTVINWAVLTSWLQGAKNHLLIDGDDSVLVVEANVVPELMSRFDHFSDLGFKTKCQVVDDLTQVEFCQSKYLACNPPLFSRNPYRALSHMAVSQKPYTGKAKLRYMAGVGLGELAASNGVPILSVIARKWSELSDKPMLGDYRLEAYGTPGEILPITDQARTDFYLAWGIHPGEQIRIENSYTPLHYNTEQLNSWYLALPKNSENVWHC